MSKTTSELNQGDRVRLVSGLVRTVDRVERTGFVNYRNEPILAVLYAEGRTDQWSGGNSAVASSEWDVCEE